MLEEKPLLVDTGRGYSLKFGSRWLYSSKDPLLTPLNIARSSPLLPDSLYILPSPCLGYGIAELLERLPDSSALLCIEADPALMDLYKSTSANCNLSSADKAFQAYLELEKRLHLRFRRSVELRLSGGWALHEKTYITIKQNIDRDIAQKYRNRLTMIKLGRLWTKNIIDNLVYLDWTRLAEIKKPNKPVLVCGAGPSLDAVLEYLPEIREKIYILAVDTALGALCSAGIKPDLIVCLEAQVYNTEDFLPYVKDKIHTIVDMTSHPSVLKNTEGPISLCLSEWTETAFLKRLFESKLPLHHVPALGSVGVLALRVARLIAQAVLVAGLDFSFLPGKTHCSESPLKLKEDRQEKRLWKQKTSWNAIMGNGVSRLGTMSFTDPALSLYAELAEIELKEAKKEGILCIDCRGSNIFPLPFHYSMNFPDAIKKAEVFIYGQKPAGNATMSGSKINVAMCQKSARDFLENEVALLGKLRLALSNGSEKSELYKLLIDADYIFSHFPDPERVLTLEEDALKRTAAETAYWIGRIELALKQLELKE